VLPFPPWCPTSNQLTWSEAGRLEQELRNAFLDQLPPDLRDCLKVIDRCASEELRRFSFADTINWSTVASLLGAGAASAIGAPTAGHRRRQFVLGHPAFSRDLSIVRNAVDAGEESVPALAAARGCSAPVVRALARVPIESVQAAREFMDGAWGLLLLRDVPPSWLASLSTMSEKGWVALRRLAEISGGPPPHATGHDLARAAARSSRAILMLHFGTTVAPEPADGYA
jgi:hypothetical protein